MTDASECVLEGEDAGGFNQLPAQDAVKGLQQALNGEWLTDEELDELLELEPEPPKDDESPARGPETPRLESDGG
jgi:hypothetical protein